MQIGFTGTRHGMTEAQKLAVADLLTAFESIQRVYHGCCVGADAHFHELALKSRGVQGSVLIHGHPSDLPEHFQFRGSCDETEPARPPLKRNRHIVNAADVMLATPAEMGEVQRSGTWATIRYARKLGKPLCIVWADGTLTWEHQSEHFGHTERTAK